MKKIFLGLALIAMLINAVGAAEIRPYVGVDAHFRVINLQNNNDGAFGSNPLQPHFYGGLRFNEVVQIETGNYTYTHQKNNYQHKVGGTHVGAMGRFMPFVSNDIHLLGGIGLTFIKKTDTWRYVKKGEGVDRAEKKITYQTQVPRILLGLEYLVSENIALRGCAIMENSSFYKTKMKDSPSATKAGNDYSMTVGLNYTF